MRTGSIFLLSIRIFWLLDNNVHGFTTRSRIRKITNFPPKRSRTVVFHEANDFLEDGVEIQGEGLDVTNSLAASPIFDADTSANINTVMESNASFPGKVEGDSVKKHDILRDEQSNNSSSDCSCLSEKTSRPILSDSKLFDEIMVKNIGEPSVKDAIENLDAKILDSRMKTENDEASTFESMTVSDIKRDILNNKSKNAVDLTMDFLNDGLKREREISGETLGEDLVSSKFDLLKDVNDARKESREFLDGQPNNVAEDEDTVTSSADTVEAILKVSQEAAEAAEAAMPEDVLESIPLIPLQEHLEKNATAIDPIILPAEEVVRKPATSTKDIEFPSIRRIMLFAASATGVFLCNPLLSLIDTSAVGLLSGTAQQAALNPGVAVTDYAALLMAFLYTGATNLVAAAQEKDHRREERPVTTNTLKTALQLSGYVGSLLGLSLFFFAQRLLRTLIGNDSINAEVFGAAMKYVRIRALGMPAAAVIGSAQAGCLGMQDIRSPFYILVAAALINLIGDTIFVGMKNSWIGGAAGAAWATIFSQYAAVFFFMRWLFTKPKPQNVNISNAIMELTGDNESQGKGRRRRFREAIKTFAKSSPNYIPANSLASKLGSITSKLMKPKFQQVRTKINKFSTRGFLRGKTRFVDLLKFPKLKDAKQYAPFVFPVTTTQIGRVSSYVTMSHVVSSTLGTSAMAAQQVIVSFFYCLTPIADSLGLTAQSMIPSIAERPPSRGRARALRKSLENFYKAGCIFGLTMVSAVLAVPLLSNFFTSDHGVATMVNSIVPLLVAFFGVHGIFMSSEGLLLGQKDLSFIGRMYATFFVAVPYFMLRVKNSALAGNKAINLTSIWNIFIIYQFVRLISFVARTFQMQKRSELAAEKAEEKMKAHVLTIEDRI